MAYPWTFNGVPINITAPALSEDVTLIYSERKIPGSPDTYLDVSGPALANLTLELHFPNPADYVTMQALVNGTTYSLNYVGGTVNAKLVSLTRTKRNLGSTGETWAQATLKIIP